MGFYMKQPVNPKECKAKYLRNESGFGVYFITACGEAQKYSYGFTLTRDPHFVGGLKVDVMGWTGPIGEGTQHYCTKPTSFPGQFFPEIIISGSNGDFLIKVEEIPHDQVDEFIKNTSSELASAN